MDARPWIAASGTLTLHALLIATAVTLVGQQAVRELARPVQVVLLAPPPRPAPLPTPAPLPAPEPARALPAPAPQAMAPKPVPPPKPAETRRPKPPARVRAQPKPVTPPAPPAPAPVATPAAPPAPVDAPRPAAISLARTPSTATDPPVPAPRAIEQPTTQPQPPAQSSGSGTPRAHATAPPAAPVRTLPRFDASWAGNAPPPYPPVARRLGEQGEVRLDVHVGPAGSVLDVRLRQSSGSSVLDQTAIETVKKWRFRPATVDGQPVAEWYHDWKWIFKLES